MSVISINNNMLAANVANTLTSHYSALATSTQRLSSGLRINGAADDAAGLAIRELMRADIAALNQGVRNANDAISMLQTFDGALSVIDEKLIRMKELAEQAATGTYDSTQRLMIDSEFQAMASEINRIANATDFNGVKLLCTKMMTWYTNEEKFVVTNNGTASAPQFSATNNGNVVLKNINAANYIDEANPAKTISVNLTAAAGTKTVTGKLGSPVVTTIPGGTQTEYKLEGSGFSVAYVASIGTPDDPVFNFDISNTDPATATNGWQVGSDTQTYAVPQILGDGNTQLSASGVTSLNSVRLTLTDAQSGDVNFTTWKTDYPNITAFQIDTKTGSFSITRNTVEINANTDDYTASYNEDDQTVTVTLKNGGTATLKLDNALAAGDTVAFDIEFEGEIQTVPVEHTGPDPNQKVKIHFGPGNDSAEDYYYIRFANATTEGLGIGGLEIKTQDEAQDALVQIRDAIVVKDQIRSDYGAMQNRLENTATSLKIQSENLQAAESRISDTDIATEMMTFVRNQILTQSAVAMLAQANSMPQMVMRLIGG